jgi:hypothetical protein
LTPPPGIAYAGGVKKKTELPESIRKVFAEYGRIGGKKGGSKGGKTRAARMSAEDRRALSRKAAQARWAKARRAT